MIPAKYSFSWANEITKRLEDSHARAAKIFYRIFNITSRNMAAWLATGDKAFAIARQRIHDIDAELENGGNYYTDVDWELFLRRKLPGSACKRFIDRLDELRKVKLS